METAGGHRGAIGAIGECDGDDGIAFLPELVESDEVGAEYRYPAIVGLTKRIGSDATELLAQCLTDDDRLIRDIAARALAYAGDATQWEAMWNPLERLLAEPTPLNPYSQIQLPGQAPKLITVVYLARHATAERQSRLVILIRSKWDRFLVQEQQCSPSRFPRLTRAGMAAPPSSRTGRAWWIGSVARSSTPTAADRACAPFGVLLQPDGNTSIPPRVSSTSRCREMSVRSRLCPVNTIARAPKRFRH
jgi:hypothetical protein